MATVNIKATNTKISASVNDYIAKNIAKIEQFLRPEHKIHIELESEPKHKTGLKFRAEVTIMPGSEIFAEARGNDFYEAIDLCMPKVKKQLMRSKDKAISSRREEGAARKRG